ncbi:MAG: type IX secretion system membrane protein PorP/SprF [Bacteroidales bacterium]|nr:type IX secretion system membrane protein PorP/SprF [Bacteroidales bacterium]
MSNRFLHIIKPFLPFKSNAFVLKWLLIFALAVPFENSLVAQQDAVYNYTMYNLLSLNPAYAGSRDALTATLLHRNQWIGFEGAPVTSTLILHSPVYDRKVNLGLTIVDDKVGVIHERSVHVDYAFRFNVTKYSQLALGLKVGVKSLSADLSTLSTEQQSDPLFANDFTSGVYPNFGFGIYFSQDKFYFGLSSPRLLEDSQQYRLGDGDKNMFFKEQRQYFLISGGIVTLSNDFDLKPTLFARATKGLSPIIDVTSTVIFDDKFQLGVMYRTSKEVGVLAGVTLFPRLFVGYSYDWSIGSQSSKYNFGSNEVVLQYDFVYFGLKKIRSPRFF